MARHHKNRTLLEITPALRAALEQADRSGCPLRLDEADGPVTGADFDRDLLAMFPGKEVVPGVRRLGVMARGKTFPFSRFPDLEVVGVVGAGERHLEELGRLRTLHWLSLLDASATHLDPLASVHSLHHLLGQQLALLQSIGGIADLPHLRTLRLDQLKALSELPTFGAAATSLRWLRLTMDMGAKPLSSLSPLAALTELRHIELFVSVGDTSLRPLHGLTRLEHVDISPAQFPKAEIAALRAALPGVAGNLHVDRDEK